MLPRRQYGPPNVLHRQPPPRQPPPRHLPPPSSYRSTPSCSSSCSSPSPSHFHGYFYPSSSSSPPSSPPYRPLPPPTSPRPLWGPTRFSPSSRLRRRNSRPYDRPRRVVHAGRPALVAHSRFPNVGTNVENVPPELSPSMIVQVRADGNCCYRSLAYPEMNHNEVRDQVAAYIRNHWLTEYSEYVTEPERQSYLAKLDRPGVWGDELSLRAFSDAYGTPVHVYTDDKPVLMYSYFPKSRNPSVAPRFVAFDKARKHYNAIDLNLNPYWTEHMVSAARETSFANTRTNLGVLATACERRSRRQGGGSNNVNLSNLNVLATACEERRTEPMYLTEPEDEKGKCGSSSDNPIYCDARHTSPLYRGIKLMRRLSRKFSGGGRRGRRSGRNERSWRSGRGGRKRSK